MLRPRLTARGVTSKGTVVWVQFTHQQDRVMMVKSYRIAIHIQHPNGKRYTYVYHIEDAQGGVAYNKIKAAKHVGEQLVALEMFGKRNKSGHYGLVPWLKEQVEAKTGLVRRIR